MSKNRRGLGTIEGGEHAEKETPHATSAEHEIFATGCSFQDLGLCDTLSSHMQERMGYEVPTHIQTVAIPAFLSNRDLLVNAETGTGKTLVYLAPIVHKLQANPKKIHREDGTYALVLVPTRELCLQVYETARQLVHRFQWLVPGYVMGGENRLKEKARLRKGATILVATPGRLLDHLENTSSFKYDKLRWMVFDEADRLLCMGFGNHMKKIMSFSDAHGSPPTSKYLSSAIRNCQHILLSATLDQQVLELASLSLKDPLTVGVKDKKATLALLTGADKPLVAVHNPVEYAFPSMLHQKFILVPCNMRLMTLMAVLHIWLHESAGHKVIVFFSTCDSVDFHYALLNEFAWSFSQAERPSDRGGFLNCNIQRLHGNMMQHERTHTFLEFNRGPSALLLSTDVAARGLDIPKVTHIIQYDPPGDANEYVHRVGRTARLGQKGEALVFLQPCEKEYLKELQKHGVTLGQLPLLRIWGKIIPSKKMQNESLGESMETHSTLVVLQKALETFICKEGSLKRLAVDAFRSFVRAYAAHKGDLKAIFQVKKLHLGHVARSFGLRDRPSLIGKSSNKKRSRRSKFKGLNQSKKRGRLTPAGME